MPVHYSIQAEVVDMRVDMPQSTDTFWVDTNIWYWLAYNRANQADQPPRRYQIRDYPAYFRNAHKFGVKFHWVGLSLAELAHLIEKTEREIFIRTNGLIGTKEFRHNQPLERARVLAEVQNVWRQIKTFAAPVDAQIDEKTTDAALTRSQTQPLDGYDLFMLEAIAKVGVIQVITDDGDFSTVPGIQVFTANQNVIQAAYSQGKLLTR